MRCSAVTIEDEMADTSKPSGKPAKNQVQLTASIDAAGDLQITGAGLVNGVIEIPSGEDVDVSIRDGASVKVYAAVVPGDGSEAVGWARDVTKGEVMLRFNTVTATRLNALFASENQPGAPNKIKYGPVITVKPKG